MKKGANGLPDPTQRRDVRQPRHLPGRPEGRPGRRPVLRRHRLRRDPPHHLHGRRQPRSDRRTPRPRRPTGRRRSRSGSTPPARPTPTRATRSPTRGTSTATASTTTRPRSSRGPRTPRARTTSACASPTRSGASHDDTVRIDSGETPPERLDRHPDRGAATGTWARRSSFSGSATDEQDGALPASALSWKLIINHCITVDNCHAHPVQDFDGVSRAARSSAPDHGYPSHLLLQVTATDSRGLTDTKTVRLDPADGEPDASTRTRRI